MVPGIHLGSPIPNSNTATAQTRLKTTGQVNLCRKTRQSQQLFLTNIKLVLLFLPKLRISPDFSVELLLGSRFFY